jgi:hypothetical protein
MQHRLKAARAARSEAALPARIWRRPERTLQLLELVPAPSDDVRSDDVYDARLLELRAVASDRVVKGLLRVDRQLEDVLVNHSNKCPVVPADGPPPRPPSVWARTSDDLLGGT